MSLEERLRERIRRVGPISFYEWMKAALYDEREGYYCRADRVRQGRAGDYRTAPETSPLFAATFASYFAKLFLELGSPRKFTIIEVGAGSGASAHGILKTLRSEYPQIFGATKYLVNEISATSRARSAARLAEFGNQASVSSPTNRDPHARSPSEAVDREGDSAMQTLPDGRASETITGIVFSNELLDAFPVNRVTMRKGKLRQLYVGIDGSDFIWVEGELEEPIRDYCERVRHNLSEGQIAEINLDADEFIAHASGLLTTGYIITVDYGAERRELISRERPAGTLRAFYRHQFVNLLTQPGDYDLTTTIDWTQLMEAGEREGLRTVRFEPLNKFLIAEGLLDRLADITRAMTDTAEALRLSTSAREMVLPTGMAAHFQVLVQGKRL